LIGKGSPVNSGRRIFS